MDNVANGPGTITTVTAYDLRNRTTITDAPGGSRTTVKLDTLGRIVSRETTTGGVPIVDYFAYDLDGNLVFQTDGQTASAAAYDAHSSAKNRAHGLTERPPGYPPSPGKPPRLGASLTARMIARTLASFAAAPRASTSASCAPSDRAITRSPSSIV